MEWLDIAAPAIYMSIGAGLAAGWVKAVRRLRSAKSALDATEAERRSSLAGRLESFQYIIESANIGTFFWDVKADIVRWSPRHYEIFGFSLDKPVTHAMFRDRVHPDDLAEIDTAMNVALGSGSDYAIRYRVCLDGGVVRHIRGSGRVDLGSDGAAAGVHGAVIDVTEAVQAQKATRERERDLAWIAMHLPDIIIRFDRDLRCVFMSQRIEDLSGKPAEFYIGKKFSEFGVPAYLVARWDAALDAVRRTGLPRDFDFNQADKNGKEHFFITRAIASFDSEGRVESILTVSSDHTDRERDARQVREDGVALQRADLRKNEYLATLAHELRGPLAPISSAAQLIRFSNERDVRDKARDIIERQVKQLAGLVDSLMEVGRISSGKLEITCERIALQGVIEQAVESATPLFEGKGQRLACALPELPVYVNGDALRLVQVFTNLLVNASKYSPPKSPVSITSRIDGDNVLVDVQDKGMGLSKSDIKDIFGLFVQVHATGIHSQGGLGIGLSLVKQLVELHGGRVSVSSGGVGAGSCFTVSLPHMGQEEKVGEAGEDPVGHTGRSLKVLVVDDNVDGANTLAMLLESLGHTAVVAYNGLDAVARIADHDLDLAFLDLGLPDISGIQVALRVRNTPRGRNLPLIALTGLGRPEDRFVTTAAKFDEHLTKPLLITDLLRITQAIAAEKVHERIVEVS